RARVGLQLRRSLQRRRRVRRLPSQEARASVRTPLHPHRPGRRIRGGRLMRVPIKVRLTAWYVTLLAVILVALGAFLLIRLRSDLVAAIDHSLATRAAQIALNYEVGGESDFKDVSDASLSTGTHGETGAQILSASLRVLQDSGDPVVSRTSMLPRADVHPMLRGGRVERTL